jgi:hypothetical protein
MEYSFLKMESSQLFIYLFIRQTCAEATKVLLVFGCFDQCCTVGI